MADADLLQVDAARQGEGQAEVDRATAHRLGYRLGTEQGDADGDVRVAFAHRLEHAGQQVAGHRFDGGDLHMAGAQALQRVQFGTHALHVLQDHGDVAREDLPGSGQAQAAGQAVEQRRADLVLQLEDLPVHRRRGDVQAPRGFADRMAAANHVEVVDRGRVDMQLAAHGGPKG